MGWEELELEVVRDADNNMMGVMNSPEAIAAAEFYRDLYACCQAPGLSNAFFAETNDAFISGQAAMAMNYFAFLPALINENTNPNYYDKAGFFANPAGPNGDRYAALGGQGMSVISYISPERQQASLDFMQDVADSLRAEIERARTDADAREQSIARLRADARAARAEAREAHATAGTLYARVELLERLMTRAGVPFPPRHDEDGDTGQHPAVR